MRRLFFLLLVFLCLQSGFAQKPVFIVDSTAINPWTKRPFENNPDNFQFAIVSDRTGGHRDGVFEKAVEKLNKLHPEFVMCVGDMIEGYTKDHKEIDRQWAEWDDILGKLKMRFFALPGNHDISNEVMRKVWLERYGKAWYHFVYKNVLFITMDSNDGDGLSISRSQIDYVKKAIADNPNVRWTMLYMHHPVWNYKDFNGFSEIEAALQSRPYTVLAGHNHQYLKTQRNNRNYYILASTGGGSQLRGPRFQEFDHITWVTFTDEGPELVNLALSGIHNDDIVDDAGLAKAKSMLDAVNFKPQLLKIDARRAQVLLSIHNSGKDTLNFNSQLYHHHQLSPNQGKFKLKIAPNRSAQVNFEVETTGNATFDKAAPLELDWQMSLPSAFMEAPYHLEGTLPIIIDFTPPSPLENERAIFLTQQKIELKPPQLGLSMRYTLDGSDPTLNAAVYQQPITVAATTVLKVRYFNTQNGAASSTWQKEYRKVTPLEGVKVTGSKTGMAYRYYEGDFQVLPDFKTLKPLKTGTVQDFNVERLAGTRTDHYAIVYEGFVEIPVDDLYYFYTRSDDGSTFYIHNQLVVDNDGSHEERARGGDIALKKGWHPFRLEYFEDFEGQSLFVGFSGEDGKRKPFFSLPLMSK
ncbi:PA14 domain-containing protein [Haliscomenobacter sp.]|uniref:PA14 domain-containing protein n=1 Tax=Haliscomenobacter sp. TaxID=2717303 RepID=UPI0035942069